MSYKFTIVKRGYDQNEVDNYIESLERQINDYKEKSTSINKALINAQFTADNIIKNAHTETEKILSNAENIAYDMKQKTLNQINSLKNKIIGQRRMIENFQSEYNFLVEKYLKSVNNNEINPLLQSLDEFDNIVDDLISPRYDKSQTELTSSITSESSFTATFDKNELNLDNESNIKKFESNIESIEKMSSSNNSIEDNESSEISPAEALYSQNQKNYKTDNPYSEYSNSDDDKIISKLEYEELNELFPLKYKKKHQDIKKNEMDKRDIK